MKRLFLISVVLFLSSLRLNAQFATSIRDSCCSETSFIQAGTGANGKSFHDVYQSAKRLEKAGTICGIAGGVTAFGGAVLSCAGGVNLLRDISHSHDSGYVKSSGGEQLIIGCSILVCGGVVAMAGGMMAVSANLRLKRLTAPTSGIGIALAF